MLNQTLLVPPDSTLQAILDCVPPATIVFANMDQMPIRGGLIIHQPVTISSQVGGTKVECPVGGIKIRCVCYEWIHCNFGKQSWIFFVYPCLLSQTLVSISTIEKQKIFRKSPPGSM